MTEAGPEKVSANPSRSLAKPRASIATCTGQSRSSLYREITDKIVAELEAGRLPWVQPWGAGTTAAPLGMPRNAATGRRYSGVNVLVLWGAVVVRGYPTQGWLTFRQTLALGGCVRRGERGTTVVHAGQFTPKDERDRAAREGDGERSVPFLKRFTVFNTAQCDGLPDDISVVPSPLPEGLVLPQAEALIRATGADLRLGRDKAFYSVGADYIQVPRPESFFEPVNWHRTALHELAHWSGAAHRLGRDLSGRFGSRAYAREELVAEIASAFLCASLDIVPTVRHADYVGDWLQVLREDDRAIVRAASAASKAADHLLAFAPDAAPFGEVVEDLGTPEREAA